MKLAIAQPAKRKQRLTPMASLKRGPKHGKMPNKSLPDIYIHWTRARYWTLACEALFMTSNCLLWHHIIRRNIKSALDNTFQAAKSRENNATTQTTWPDQQRQRNQHTWAAAFEQSTTNSSRQNKFYAWIDFKQVGGSASCLLYPTSDKHNTLKLQINSRFPTTSPFTCPFLCSFSIASHRSLLPRQTWRVWSEWLTGCGNKNKSEKPRFSSLFTPLQRASNATTRAPN